MHKIFGRVVAETPAPPQGAVPPAEFLFEVHISENDSSALRVTATDFKSSTFQAVKSRQQLEDLRDDIGIGGSWSEFVEYLVISLKFGDVKLHMEGAHARLIAQKAKGMPRVSIFLSKVVDGTACEAMANLSLELYNEFKDLQISLTKEQENKYQLTKVVAAEQEKNVTLQKQLDMVLYSRKHKSQKINDGDNLDSVSVSVSQNSPNKPTAYKASPTKGPTRVVPLHGRSKVRGAILDDAEDDA